VATIAEGIDKAVDTMSPDSGWSPERIAAAAQPILLEAAGEVTPGQLRKVAAQVALTLDGESGERRRAQIERQSFLDIGQTMDGVGVLRGDLGAATSRLWRRRSMSLLPVRILAGRCGRTVRGTGG
jgi:hypothetical protein